MYGDKVRWSGPRSILIKVWPAALAALLLGGCASLPEPSAPRAATQRSPAEPPPSLRDDRPAYADQPLMLDSLRDSLHDQARQWRGVPYRYGGLSENGVDCSGFVYLTFQSRLGIELPRTTRELAKQGERVDRDELRAGDLVFFKTGFRDRHVGIYMGGGRFLHASTSRGVMTSSLNNVYWRKHYWKARRLDLPPPEPDQPLPASLSSSAR